MSDNKNYISMPCGGKGNCGKCRIKVVKGFLSPNERDRKFLSDGEIKNGLRIACGHKDLSNIEFVSYNEDFETVSQYFEKDGEERNILSNYSNDGYAVAVDVGTTTLCFVLIDKTGREVKTATAANSQRLFGADILSRVSKASFGGFSQLVNILKSDLKKGISEVCCDIGGFVGDIFMAGNTVMTYFLRNMDCRSLGAYPFENNAKDTFRQKALSFFEGNLPDGIDNDTQINILPCIEAFIGGDVVSGAFFLNIDKKENCLFIDIGTNGEIILNYKGKLYCSSVAAGPAFEGGAVSCGAAGINGAINSVSYKRGVFEYTTIGNKSPIGICGSALIDLLSLLLENGFINSDGLLKDDYFSKGVCIADGVFFTQKDIRQLQLAKSAVLSGIQCILEYAQASFDDIEKFYIGGGFGFYLNCKSALKIKMFPEEFLGKTEFCGNTSIGGLVKIYKTKDFSYEKFVLNTKYVNIAEMENFQNTFINNLNF